jgi:branched-chain amino acid transport system permease protein
MALPSRLAREAWPIGVFATLALVPLLSAGDPFILSLVSRGMILGLAALALDLILGYGALVSFGHAAFIGIGAYAVAIAASHGVDEFLIAVPLALAAGVLFALVTGAISLKTRGVYFIMITLAFAQMAYFTTQSLTAYGGDDGLSMAHRSLLFGTKALENDIAFYALCLGVLTAVYLASRRLVASRFGRALRATRENERRAAALGFDVFRLRLAAYAISGGIAALSGVLFANLTEFVAPAYLSWQRSGELIVMVVLGGMGTLHGAILGAVAVVLTEEALSHVTQHWKAIFGPLIILLALFAKGGLVRLIGGKR